MEATMKRTLVKAARLVGAVALATFGVTGCGGGEEDPKADDPGTIEIFSWWYSKSESAALNALIDVYKKDHQGVEVVNAAAAASGIDGAVRLEQRMTAGLPPDTFQVYGGVRLMEWVKYNGVEGQSKLEPLDDLAKSSGWISTVPSSIVETLKHNDHVYAVPVNIHRVNCLFYNKKIFNDSGLVPPTTLDELITVSAALAEKNITPLAVSARDSSSPALAMWEILFVMSAGPEYYEAFFKGKKSPNDPEVRAALDAGLKVFGYANADAETLGWGEAVELVGSGGAAMHMNGDWVKGELDARGYKMDVDYGMLTLGADAFVYVTDSFVLPRGAPNREAVRDLLSTMGSVEGQDALNPLKGSIPARTDAGKSSYDAQSQQAMADAKNPAVHFVPARNIIVPFEYYNTTNDAFKTFLTDKDAEKVIKVMDGYYNIIQDYYAQP
jgi:glucose/mannose transport system substrate-binding protein